MRHFGSNSFQERKETRNFGPSAVNLPETSEVRGPYSEDRRRMDGGIVARSERDRESDPGANRARRGRKLCVPKTPRERVFSSV